MAERVGFEPTEACTSLVFKTRALNRSATSPQMDRSLSDRSFSIIGKIDGLVNSGAAPLPALFGQLPFYFCQDILFQGISQVPAGAKARFRLEDEIGIPHRVQVGLHVIRGNAQAGPGQDG
jgi:hypothetical protein